MRLDSEIPRGARDDDDLVQLVTSVARGSKVFNRSSFQFLDPGPLRDGELQLVAPHERLADLLLEAANHPMTLATEAHEPRLNPQQETPLSNFHRAYHEFLAGD